MNTLEELISSLEKKRVEIRGIKRFLRKDFNVDTAARLAIRLNQLNEEYDVLMLMKVQHDLLTYLQDGGIPVIKYEEQRARYEVRIPGSVVSAYVNEEGLKIVQSYVSNNSTTTQICQEDESAPN